MRSLIRWPPQRWLCGLIALGVWLLLPRLSTTFVSTREGSTWVMIVCFIIAVAFAVWGFPSWSSIVALIWLALSSPLDRIVMSADFQMLLWLLFTAGSIVVFSRYRGAPALLLIIGSLGFTVIFGLHAFSIYTQAMALDDFAWSHWSFECLARIAAAATLCFPLGLTLFARNRAAASNQAMQPTAGRRTGLTFR